MNFFLITNYFLYMMFREKDFKNKLIFDDKII